MKMIESEPDPPSLMQFLCEGDKITLYLLPERTHILAAIAVSLHAGISQIQVVLSAHRHSLLSAVLYKSVIDIIQLFTVLREKL